MYYAMIECSTKCPKCENSLFLNGPVEVVHCNHCQNDISIPHSFWRSNLRDILKEVKNELKEGQGRYITTFGALISHKINYAHLKPKCEKCETPIEIEKDVTESFTYICPKCKNNIPILLPPKWLHKLFPYIKLLVNAELQTRTGKEPPAVSGPIVLSCPKCGGTLTIDGTNRLVHCQFCGVNVYLPDDLWLRLHPARTKNRWFIGFE